MLDLDDTTVVHGKKNLPSARVTQAIAKAKEKIHVCLATARPLPDTKSIMTHLKLSGPCIITNGTQIYDPITKKIIRETVLPRDVIPAVYAICLKYSVRTICYDGERDSQYFGGPIPPKVLSIYLSEVDRQMVDGLVSELKNIPHVNVQKLNAWNKQFMSIDVTHENATKLHGIVEVAKILGIRTEEIIGVGDGYNDFPLLMACGLKIAMGNAVPELKSIADFVAPSVYDDGVATVIEKFVLTS